MSGRKCKLGDHESPQAMETEDEKTSLGVCVTMIVNLELSFILDQISANTFQRLIIEPHLEDCMHIIITNNFRQTALFQYKHHDHIDDCWWDGSHRLGVFTIKKPYRSKLKTMLAFFFVIVKALLS